MLSEFEIYALTVLLEADEQSEEEDNNEDLIADDEDIPTEPIAPMEPPEPALSDGEINGLRIALAALLLDPSKREEVSIRVLKILDENNPSRIFSTISRVTNIPIRYDITDPIKKQSISQIIVRALKFNPKDIPLNDDVLSQQVTKVNAKEVRDRIADLVNII